MVANRCAQTLRPIKEGQKLNHISHAANIAESIGIIVSRDTIGTRVAANLVHEADNTVLAIIVFKELAETRRARIDLLASSDIGHNASIDVKGIGLVSIMVDESDDALVAGKSVSVRNSHFENLLFFSFLFLFFVLLTIIIIPDFL
jgi:hypothetical protein